MLKRRLIRLGVGLFLVTAILYASLVWWCASEIANPGRRPVGESHAAYFDGSAGAGFKVTKFVSEDGMPCLICTPQPTEDFSKRASTIRGQIHEMGIEVDQAGEIAGTLVILHGRSGMKENYLAVAERFCAVGFRCVIPDLPGHGANPEKYATYGVKEARMVLDGYLEAADEFGFSDEPCAIWGQSMGGSVAVHTVALPDSPFRTMVVVASFDRLETVIRSQTMDLFGSSFGAAVRAPSDVVFGWKTGVRISEINPIEKAPGIRVPTLIVHGDSDRSVPTAAGKKLYASLPESIAKKWLTVPGAGHNNVLITDFPLYASMAGWLLEHISPQPSDSPASAPR